MPENKRPREHAIPMGGIFLLFLGVVFLLQSLNILPWALWGILWRFWPVLIIITGLGILLARYNIWLVSVLVLALLFACLGIAIGQYEPSLHGIPGKLSSLHFMIILARHPYFGLLSKGIKGERLVNNLLLSGQPSPEGTPDSELGLPKR